MSASDLQPQTITCAIIIDPLTGERSPNRGEGGLRPTHSAATRLRDGDRRADLHAEGLARVLREHPMSPGTSKLDIGRRCGVPTTSLPTALHLSPEITSRCVAPPKLQSDAENVTAPPHWQRPAQAASTTGPNNRPRTRSFAPRPTPLSSDSCFSPLSAGPCVACAAHAGVGRVVPEHPERTTRRPPTVQQRAMPALDARPDCSGYLRTMGR